MIVSLPCSNFMFSLSQHYLLPFVQSRFFVFFLFSVNDKFERDNSCNYSIDVFIVFKLGSDIDSAGVLGHWVNGRTTESMIEPHD